MITIPDIIRTEARRGELLYAVEILPNAGESWTAHRWATQECRIDGEDYEGGAITKVGRISYRAKIKQGGSAATRDRVEVTARNRKADGSARFQDFAEQPIGGRIISIKAGVVPPNLVKNSSFEDETASAFDHWTEVPGSGGSITQTTSGEFGTYRCQIFSTDSGNKSRIDTEAMPYKRGQSLYVSFYLQAQTAGDQCEVFFQIHGTHGWIVSSQTWGLSPVVTETYTPSTGSMTRYSFEIPIEKLDEFFVASTLEDATITLGFNAAGTTDLIYVDGVMISPREYLIDYTPALHDIASTDLIALYTGEVFDYELTNEKIRIITRSIASLRHRKIPITTLDEELTAALGANWVIPSHNIGKPIPITYGAFDTWPRKQQDQRLVEKVPAYGILSNYIDGDAAGDEIQVLFDRPGGVITHYQYEDIFAWDEDGQQWLHQMYDDRVAPIFVASEFIEDLNGCAFKAASGVGFLNGGRFPISIYQRGREMLFVGSGGTGQIWLSPANTIDYDILTYSQRTATTDSGNSWIKYAFEPITVRDGTLISAYLCIDYAHSVTAITAGDVTLKVYMKDLRPASPYVDTITLLTRTSTGDDTFNNMPLGFERETDFEFLVRTPADTLAWWATGGLSVSPNLDSSKNGGGNWTGYARCYDLQVRLDVSVDLLETVFFGSIHGREFLSTWETRKTAGNEIEVCSDTIEGLLRDELGIDGADIDTDSFDDVYTARSGATGITLAGQVTKLTDSEDVIDEMCKNSGLMYYNDLDGKEKLVALDKKATPDIAIGYGDLIEDSLKIRFARRDEVVTDFILNYGFNPVSEEYHLRHYCNKDGSSFTSGGSTYETLCDNAFDAVGLKVVREFNCKWLNDTVFAQNQLKFLVNWLTYPKCFVAFETYFDMAGIELGDQALLNFPRHMPSSTEDSYFVVESISAKRSTRRIRLELIEIRDAA